MPNNPGVNRWVVFGLLVIVRREVIGREFIVFVSSHSARRGARIRQRFDPFSPLAGRATTFRSGYALTGSETDGSTVSVQKSSDKSSDSR